MIKIDKVKEYFYDFLDKYDIKNAPGFNLKEVHTLNVVKNAKELATKMNLSEEDINLAQLIAYLHDLGRFEELKVFKGFNSAGNDHAMYGSQLLFGNNLIREFIEDDKYDSIIKKAIENHNKFAIEDGLNERELLHAKIIRDADKLDNFRVKEEESASNLFPGMIKTADEFNNSLISDKVFNDIMNNKCVDIHDRVYPLDYWLCVMAFVFDLNFKETFLIVKEKDYMNILIDKIKYTNPETIERMKLIKKQLNDFVDSKIGLE